MSAKSLRTASTTIQLAAVRGEWETCRRAFRAVKAHAGFEMPTVDHVATWTLAAQILSTRARAMSFRRTIGA